MTGFVTLTFASHDAMGIQVSEAAPEKRLGSPSKEAGNLMDLDSVTKRKGKAWQSSKVLQLSLSTVNYSHALRPTGVLLHFWTHPDGF